jgi:DNA-binding transcriptional regulator YdaS (Cro superfamily)
MKKTHIATWCAENSQKALADALGISAGAINQMLKEGRDITVVESKGRITAYETRPIPASKNARTRPQEATAA